MASNDKNYIPGLDMLDPLIIKQADEKFVSLYESYGPRISQYMVDKVIKETPPTVAFSGYDVNHHQLLTIVSYKKITREDNVLEDKCTECLILSQLDHENILEFYGIISESNFHKSCLSFEPFHCFLSQLLCEQQDVLNLSVIKCLIFQLFKGLKYMHDKNIVHRDITAKNLALTEKGVLKISNFKSARKVGSFVKEVLTAEICYQPLDMLLGSKTFSTATDIWSATCVFAELLLKNKLFKSNRRCHLIKEIFSVLGFPGENIWPEIVDMPDYKYFDPVQYHKYNFLGKYFEDNQSLALLRGGFIYNPMYRISADECLNHPYFQENPQAIDKKAFGVLFNGKDFSFPVKY